MALDRRRMTGNYLPLRDAIDHLFEGSFISPQMLSGQGVFPQANVRVTDDDVIIEMAIPGADPDDITVSVSGDTVTISGEVTKEQHDKRGQTYIEEITVGAFQRSFTLPFPVDVSKADASFENGMLRLSLPKSEAAKPRKVQVSRQRSHNGRGQHKSQKAEAQQPQNQQPQSQQSLGQQQQNQEQTDSNVQKERVPAGSGQKS